MSDRDHQQGEQHMRIKLIATAAVAMLLGALVPLGLGDVASASDAQHVAWFQGYPLTVDCDEGESPVLFFNLRVTENNMLELPAGTEPGDNFHQTKGSAGTIDDVIAVNPTVDFRLHTFWRDDPANPIDGFNVHLNVPVPYNVKLHTNGRIEWQTIAWRFRVGTEDARIFTAWMAHAVPENGGPNDAMRLTRVQCNPWSRGAIPDVGNPIHTH